MKKLIIALVCMVFTVNAQLVGTIRVDIQGTATNSTGISGSALGIVTGIANTVIAPYTNLPAVIAAGDLAGSNYAYTIYAVLTGDVARASSDGTNNVAAVRTELTNRVTAVEGYTNRAATAWQNPASATNCTWTSDGTQITLTGYSGPAAVVIPDTLDGLPVTGFGVIFAGVAITSISGGENVTSIGNGAFVACTALTNVTLKAAMSIGINAFNICTALTSVTIPAATSVSGSAFRSCTALTSAYFGQNAPAEASSVYTSTPNVTNYVTSPTATGWGATWNGRPVVRLPVYADEYWRGGTNLTDLLAAKLNANATPGDIGAEVAGAAAAVQTNLTTHTNRTDNPHAVTPAQIGAISNTPAGIAAAGGVTNGMPMTLTMTNLTTMADGVYQTTNGVYFTRNSTNYWILFQ